MYPCFNWDSCLCLLRQLFSISGWLFSCGYASQGNDKKWKKAKGRDAFYEVEHEHENPVAGFDYARINESIIHFIMFKRKAPINMLYRSEATKTQQVELCQHPKNTSGF